MMADAYSPLDTQTQQIRLVKIAPASEIDAPIICSLLTVSLKNNPEYEALSYVCGDTKTKLPISIYGRDIRVTKNLEEALRGIRHRDELRTIWIDAISINQNDINERSQQILLMGQIYRQAARVVAWLGQGNDVIYKAVDLITKGAENSTLHWDTATYPSTNLGLDVGFGGKHNFIVLGHLLRCPWWFRIWTVQEVILPKIVTFMAGTRTFDFDGLPRLSRNFTAHKRCCAKVFDSALSGMVNGIEDTLLSVIGLENRRKQEADPAMLDLLSSYRYREATHQSDKVYALLGLIKEIPAGFVDYRHTWQQVFQDTVLHLIQSTNSLDVLSHAFNYSRQKAGDEVPLPSWIPDWAHREMDGTAGASTTEALNHRIPWLPLYGASGLLNPSVSHMEPDILCLKGTLIDKIVDVGSALDPRSLAFYPHATFKEWSMIAGMNEPKLRSLQYVHMAGCNRFEAFLRTMCADVGFWGKYASTSAPLDPQPKRAQKASDLRLFEDWWYKNIGIVEKAKLDYASMTEVVTSPLASHLCKAALQRRFAISQKGFMGLVPAHAVPGDLITVLFGAKVPFVLRSVERRLEKNGNFRQVYQLLGDAYIQGFMDGEAVQALNHGVFKSKWFVIK